jgi:hypothetical protein
MHSSNFVIDITPDFEEVEYRLRAIDFDQQSFEGRRNIYLPQYFKQNNPLISIGLKLLTPESVRQYQREERSLIANRIRVEKFRIDDLLGVMEKENLSTPENILRLSKELAEFYEDTEFLQCQTMGALVGLSLEMLVRRPELYKDY